VDLIICRHLAHGGYRCPLDKTAIHDALHHQIPELSVDGLAVIPLDAHGALRSGLPAEAAGADNRLVEDRLATVLHISAAHDGDGELAGLAKADATRADHADLEGVAVQYTEIDVAGTHHTDREALRSGGPAAPDIAGTIDHGAHRPRLHLA